MAQGKFSTRSSIPGHEKVRRVNYSCMVQLQNCKFFEQSMKIMIFSDDLWIDHCINDLKSESISQRERILPNICTSCMQKAFLKCKKVLPTKGKNPSNASSRIYLPWRSLFKLCPTKIVPWDKSFFMDFYKPKEYQRKLYQRKGRTKIPGNLVMNQQTCTFASEEFTPFRCSAVTPVISVL